MPAYQDTRSTSKLANAILWEGTKHSSNNSVTWYPYKALSVIGSQQSITSVRTTKRPKHPVFDGNEREVNYVSEFDRFDRALSLSDRPDKGIKRKVWELCNPNPCEIRQNVRKAETNSASLSMLKCKQKGDPSWSWWDYYWMGDIMGYLLAQYMPMTPYQLLPNADTIYRNLALSKAYSNLKASPVGIGVHIAELRETIEMLVNPLKSLRKFLTSNGWKIFSDTTKLSTDLWLEYRYGWMPLVYAVQNGIDAVNGVLEQGFGIHPVRGGSHKAVLDTTVRFEKNVAAQLVISGKLRTCTSLQAKAVLASRNGCTHEKFLGTRWQDLPVAAWEGITLSFVWDWFFNIGQWLQSIVPDPDVKVLANSVSLKKTYELTLTPVSYGVGAQYVNKGRIMAKHAPLKEASYKEAVLIRTVNHPVPSTPVVRHQLLSLARVADAVSLLLGRLMSLTRRR